MTTRIKGKGGDEEGGCGDRLQRRTSSHSQGPSGMEMAGTSQDGEVLVSVYL